MTCRIFTTPTPPNFLVFGRNPIAFGDIPPLEEPQDFPDATEYFGIRTKISERAQKAIQAIHSKIAALYQKIFSGKRYANEEKVWLKVHKTTPKETGKKLDIRWSGPCEVLKHIVEGRYKISHPVAGELDVHMD